MYAALKLLHVLGVVLWVGGMAFVLLFLRPSLAVLQPADRLKLMREVLGRFFAAVLALVVVVLGTGMALIGNTIGAVNRGGGTPKLPWDWLLMSGLGLVMAGVYAFVRVGPFARFLRLLEQDDVPGAAAALAQVRLWVTVNFVIGLIIITSVVLH